MPTKAKGVVKAFVTCSRSLLKDNSAVAPNPPPTYKRYRVVLPALRHYFPVSDTRRTHVGQISDTGFCGRVWGLVYKNSEASPLGLPHG
jgi:hypothetical protein